MKPSRTKILIGLCTMMIILLSLEAFSQKLFDVYVARDADKFIKMIKRNPDMIYGKDKDGFSVLANICASKEYSSADYLNYMLLYVPYLDVNRRDQAGMTLLIYCAGSGVLDKVQMLVNHRADVNQAGEYHFTPLMAAANTGDEEIVDLLLRNGAKVNVQAENGRTALICATRHGNKSLTDRLLLAGADPNMADEDKNNALFYASGYPFNAEKGDLCKANSDIVLSYLKKGVNVNGVNSKGCTSLMYACREGNADVVRTLITNGADVNVKDNGGTTPLIFAAYNGHQDIAQLLVEKNANIKATDNDGQDAIYYAKKNNYYDLAKYLEGELKKENKSLQDVFKK